MISVAGVFKQPEAAQRALNDLRIIGAGGVYMLVPETAGHRMGAVPAAASEAPGMAQTMGAFVACVVGVAAGLALGATAGPALGYLGAAVLGLAGAVSGGLVGRRIGRATFDGLPADEFFVYNDALRQGRSVVCCLTPRELEADEARAILHREGAESVDPARHQWWLGLTDSERTRYAPPPRACARPDTFSRGVAAALSPEFHGKPWDQVVYLLAERYRYWYEDTFRNGFEAGQRC
jgi:hypothetical protein